MEHEIHLSDEEARLLAAVLLSERDETREELRRTDNITYKEQVQNRLDQLETILDRVQRTLHAMKV